LQTSNRFLISTVWTGGTFSTTVPPVTAHDGTNTVESAASRSFDFAWEMLPSASGKGWLLWGSQGGGGIRSRYLTAPSTWGGVSAAIRDRTLLVQSGAMSPSGRFVAGVYHSTAAAVANRVTESVTTTGGGAAWPTPLIPAATTLWAGPTTVQQGERVFVMTREAGRINTGPSGTGVVSILQTQETVPP